jgi:hypothetical protein
VTPIHNCLASQKTVAQMCRREQQQRAPNVKKDVIERNGEAKESARKGGAFRGSQRMLPIYSKRRCTVKSLLMIPL